ncbi:Terminase small subunit [uncultured Caudovirales phage]|uniref:Terminase small subunit n=1 Tax=uncultured Caudovirales phage TaxID=2100421 RepID=A0A6J5NUN2_9CAUD|nr:Terminase small subunit [uncultured Caudovirales phage]
MGKIARVIGGRHIQSAKLTDKQEAFCLYMSQNGGNSHAAAASAGYSDRKQASQLMENPVILHRLKFLQTQRISGSMANKALDVLEDIMGSPAYPAAARVSAAKTVLEMSGHGIVAQGQRLRYGLEQDGKGLEEMSTTELEAFVSRQRAALDSLEDVSRSHSAPLIELNDSGSTDYTASVGQ